MGNINISALPGLGAGPITSSTIFHANKNSADIKVTFAEVLNNINEQYSSDIEIFLNSSDAQEGRLNLNIDRRLSVDNSDVTLTAGVKYVSQVGTMSAPRVFTLPEASLTPPGAEIIIADESGSVDITNNITVQRASTDLIDGETSKTIKNPYGFLKLMCNGSDGWKVTSSYFENQVPVGAEFYVAYTVAPEGYLESNGAELLISNYGELASAIYVGDANNADTNILFGFKTDGAGNRSITGTHIKIPDRRGEFVRGWDNGRGIDTGRVFGSGQLDAFQNIAGPVGNGRGFPGPASSGLFTRSAGTGNPAGTGSAASAVYRTDFDTANDPSLRTAAETRPRNLTALAIIKY